MPNCTREPPSSSPAGQPRRVAPARRERRSIPGSGCTPGERSKSAHTSLASATESSISFAVSDITMGSTSAGEVPPTARTTLPGKYLGGLRTPGDAHPSKPLEAGSHVPSARSINDFRLFPGPGSTVWLSACSLTDECVPSAIGSILNFYRRACGNLREKDRRRACHRRPRMVLHDAPRSGGCSSLLPLIRAPASASPVGSATDWSQQFALAASMSWMCPWGRRGRHLSAAFGGDQGAKPGTSRGAGAGNAALCAAAAASSSSRFHWLPGRPNQASEIPAPPGVRNGCEDWSLHSWLYQSLSARWAAQALLSGGHAVAV